MVFALRWHRKNSRKFLIWAFEFLTWIGCLVVDFCSFDGKMNVHVSNQQLNMQNYNSLWQCDTNTYFDLLYNIVHFYRNIVYLHTSSYLQRVAITKTHHHLAPFLSTIYSKCFSEVLKVQVHKKEKVYISIFHYKDFFQLFSEKNWKRIENFTRSSQEKIVLAAKILSPVCICNTFTI